MGASSTRQRVANPNSMGIGTPVVGILTDLVIWLVIFILYNILYNKLVNAKNDKLIN